VLQLLRAPHRSNEAEEPQLGHGRCREPARRQEDRIGIGERLDEIEEECSGGHEGPEPEGDRHPEEVSLMRAPERNADERRTDEGETDPECKLESECHRRIL
jgi:hypothetical protein